jgi:predicted acetyltransferase
MTAEIRIDVATAAEQPLLEGLMQFYIYDFSELEPDGSDDLDFTAAGRFEPFPYLADYWREAGRVPLLIRRGDKPVGFALINRHSHLGEPLDRNMAEFFVARKHRRHRVASEAVRQVLARYPGRWEVAVAQRNVGALKFWPGAIAAAPNVSALVRREGDGERWRGPVYTFLAG